MQCSPRSWASRLLAGATVAVIAGIGAASETSAEAKPVPESLECEHVPDVSGSDDVKGMTTLIWDEVRAGETLDVSGRPTSGLPYGLAQGIVGVVGDSESGYSVVVDTVITSEETMRRRLDGRLPPSARDSVEVEASCVEASLLARAWKAVHAVDWASYADGERVGIYLDAAVERIVVESVAAQNLKPALGELDSAVAELVRIDALLDMHLAGRINGEAPWNGGLRINRSDGSYCSGGFTVIRRSNNHRAMVTAGHCGGNGVTWRNGSDNDVVGTSTARSNYPEYDQMLLVGGSYSPQIWVGGDQGTVMATIGGP